MGCLLSPIISLITLPFRFVAGLIAKGLFRGIFGAIKGVLKALFAIVLFPFKLFRGKKQPPTP
ncbi:MAG: hypothetical protein HY261_02445 [Chloroflexi bacterium]|nr:hypothetical protein [Chloroflexota bacterium]